ncbi:MAG: glycoside hydrolase family 3 protein [Deltaproteobacteria bacterium]|nr:glycoside hydrolase family 3 protein [Deltaproteobacteria bacterium]
MKNAHLAYIYCTSFIAAVFFLLIVNVSIAQASPENKSYKKNTSATELNNSALRHQSYSDWPKIKSNIPLDKAIEAKITDIIANMTLAQKIGQMVQADTANISPDEVRQYYIGSILSGGDAFPVTGKTSLVTDWLKFADEYWQASMSTDAKVKIPLLYGIDAVHGHARIFGATVFPHNIALGATRNPDLVRRIGVATAIQLRATGHDWTFAPCLAVARDDRWGRTYESFSEDPTIARIYGQYMVEGLQQNIDAAKVKNGVWFKGVMATAKHFIGDGNTLGGIDQGISILSPIEMINIHGQGYYGALAAGAQSVMASYSSWETKKYKINEGKVHGSKLLLTKILKEKMGFDGLLISDWDAIGQVEGCTNSDCARAVNAGLDMIMLSKDYKEFITNTIAQVKNGEIPIARINDAVTRILRVKLRAGIFALPKPSKRYYAGDPLHLVHHKLAREAVKQSIVLLKNNNHTLPLKRQQKVLVVGKNANSIPNQCGGWTLTWQNTSNRNADFPNGTTILDGIKKIVGVKNVTYSIEAKKVDVRNYDTVIAVIGETPYAEMKGDIGFGETLEHAELYPEDIGVLQRVSGKAVPVVTIFISGRPLYTNKEINHSDAFIAAWLPGTEGAAVAEMLFYYNKGSDDFTGKLPFSWPKNGCQTPLNIGDKNYDPLFAYNFGLSLSDDQQLDKLKESSTDGCF